MYDPNGDSYEYVFRHNNEGEDLNAKESGNVYIWTPVTVVHYDATGAMGMVVEGGVALEITRGLASRSDSCVSYRRKGRPPENAQTASSLS